MSQNAYGPQGLFHFHLAFAFPINGFSRKIGCDSTLAFFVSGPERMPNGPRTEPERTPNVPRTDPERTPHEARMDPARTRPKVSRTCPERRGWVRKVYKTTSKSNTNLNLKFSFEFRLHVPSGNDIRFRIRHTCCNSSLKKQFPRSPRPFLHGLSQGRSQRRKQYRERQVRAPDASFAHRELAVRCAN